MDRLARCRVMGEDMNTVALVRGPQAMMDTAVGALMQKLRSLGLLLGRVCEELRHNYQTVADLTFFLVLGMATLACQDGIYVRMRDGTLVPLTGYFFVSGPPGCGKSTLLHRLLEPFMKAEAEAAEDSESTVHRYLAALSIWQAQRRKLKREIDKAIAHGEDTDALSAELEFLLAQEPCAPLTASWLAEDTTIQALRRRLHKVWPSAGIVLDEGIRFFMSTLSRAFADFCTLYDARLARNDRITSGSESVERAFLSKVIATQRMPLFAFLKEHGQKAFDTGYLARLQLFDVTAPVPPRVSDGRAMRTEALHEFDNRVLALKRDARQRMESGVFEPVVIDLSEAADALLAGVPLQIRAHTAARLYSVDMGPYLLRLPILIVRIAGVLHRFEGYSGEISADTMSCAIEIGFWLAQQTNDVLVRCHEPSPEERADMDAVVHMLRTYAYQHRRPFIVRGELWDMAPSFGLNEVRCKRAIHYLCQVGVVWLGRRGNAAIIGLSPQYFPQ